MNIVCNPTLETTTADGCDCRIYEGITENGIRVHMLVAGLMPVDRADLDALRAMFNAFLELARQSTPAI
jgi:hypothetical protein